MTASILEGFSIEVMPRTLAKIDDLEALFPPGTRVYLAHIEGVDFQDMLAAAASATAAARRKVGAGLRTDTSRA